MLVLTRDGLAGLADWVRDANTALAGPAADPIRTRSYALDTLPLTERMDRLSVWIEATTASLADVRLRLVDFRTAADVAEVRAYRAAELELEARLSWLHELASEYRGA